MTDSIFMDGGGVSMRRYDVEFKREALRLASDPNTSDRTVERDLGLYQGAIRAWRAELGRIEDGTAPGMKRGDPAEAELRALRLKNARLREERDILKKAAAYFSRDAIRATRS
jgi:transposase